jgi:amidase
MGHGGRPGDDDGLATASVTALAAGVREGRWRAADLVEHALAALADVHGRTGCVAALDADGARATAVQRDAVVAAGGPVGPLHGVPFTVKDWVDAAGLPCSGELDHRDRVPDEDATAVARLRTAGAVLVAKTAVQVDSALFGPVRNPHRPERNPGASSSGEGAAVGGGASPFGLGSDSGGSIRVPAAWCGAAGLKPTAGRVPTTGHFPRVGPRSDGRTQIGPLARHAGDLDLVLRVIAGPDGRDPGVAPVPLGAAADVHLPGLRLAWCTGEPGWEPQPAVRDAVEWAVATLTGADGLVGQGEAALRLDEAYDVTDRYWRRRALTGAEAGRQLRDWDRYARRALVDHEDVDVVVLPAVREVAPVHRALVGEDYAYTLPASLTGWPAAVVPVGWHDDLPVAVQILARPWRDDVATAVATALARAAAPATAGPGHRPGPPP